VLKNSLIDRIEERPGAKAPEFAGFSWGSSPTLIRKTKASTFSAASKAPVFAGFFAGLKPCAPSGKNNDNDFSASSYTPAF
jgi:hypothetical protein